MERKCCVERGSAESAAFDSTLEPVVTAETDAEAPCRSPRALLVEMTPHSRSARERDPTSPFMQKLRTRLSCYY